MKNKLHLILFFLIVFLINSSFVFADTKCDSYVKHKGEICNYESTNSSKAVCKCLYNMKDNNSSKCDSGYSKLGNSTTSIICEATFSVQYDISGDSNIQSDSRFIAGLDSKTSYVNVKSCDTTEFIAKDYVSDSKGTKKVLGCAYNKNSSRIPTVNCSGNGDYTAVKIIGKDAQNNNKSVALYVCKKNINTKARFIVSFKNTSYVDVSNCDTSVGYIDKAYVSDTLGSKLIYGCAYSNTGSHIPSVGCSKSGYSAVLYKGSDKNSNGNSVNVYLCQKNDSSQSESNNDTNQPNTSNPGTGSNPSTPSTTTPNEDNDTNNGGGKDTGTVIIEDGKPRLDYDNICASEGFMTASKIAGIVILIAKWLAPLILIIMGMIDFFKAVISSSDKALSDATETFIKRMVIAIIIPIIPGLLYYLADYLIGDEINNTEIAIGDCTKCLKNPFECANTNDEEK